MSEPHIVSDPLPILYAGSPLRPQPGDPGWPLHRNADDPADAPEGLSVREGLVTCYEKAITANIEFAEQVCKRIALAGGVPYAPHLIFPRFLTDTVEAERDLVINMGKRMITIVDEAWFFVPPWRRDLSSGMSGERVYAERLGIATRVCYDDAAFEIQLRRLQAREVKLRAMLIPSGTFLMTAPVPPSV